MNIGEFFFRAGCASALFACIAFASGRLSPTAPAIAHETGAGSMTGSSSAESGQSQSTTWAAIDTTGPNAADRYRAAFKIMDARIASSGRWNPRHRELVAEFTRGNQDVVRAIIEATALPRCDWELALSDGPLTILEHLQPMQRAAMILEADARAKTEAGDGVGAAMSLGAGLRLAAHFGQDGLFLSSLCSARLIDRFADAIGEAIDSGRSDERARSAIQRAIESLNPKDPCGFRRAIRGERQCIVSWLRRALAAPESSRRVDRILAESLSGDELARVQQEIRGASDPGGLKNLLARLEGAFTALEDAWAANDPVARLGPLGERLNRGDFGSLAATFVAPMIKGQECCDQAVLTVGGLRSRLSARHASAPRMEARK